MTGAPRQIPILCLHAAAAKTCSTHAIYLWAFRLRAMRRDFGDDDELSARADIYGAMITFHDYTAGLRHYSGWSFIRPRALKRRF